MTSPKEANVLGSFVVPYKVGPELIEVTAPVSRQRWEYFCSPQKLTVNINNANFSGPIEITNQYMGMASMQQQMYWDDTVVYLKDCVSHLHNELSELREEIQQLCRMRTFVVPIATLAPEPFEITGQIPVTVEGDGEEFIATFSEANVSASGETEADAIANFKEALVSSFELLEQKSPQELGPLPTRQWGILKSVVRRTEYAEHYEGSCRSNL